MTSRGPQTPPPDDRTIEKVREWARKLVVLTRQNRVLYYRATKRTTLTYRRPGLGDGHADTDALLDRLLRGSPFTFYVPDDVPVGTPKETSLLELELARQLVVRPPKAGEFVTTQPDPAEIRKSLDAIARKARAEFEDRGTHVLYLAWGLLRWKEPRSDDLRAAPILLVPVELIRDSVRQGYKLQVAKDSDPAPNPALRIKLRDDHNITFPDPDANELDPPGLLAEISGLIPDDWTIEHHAAIGLFSFAKESMYRDLMENATTVATHPIVRSMAHGSATPEVAGGPSSTIPQEQELDLASEPGFTVIDADTSQRVAIEAAVRGMSFVLHGPPGTGKSQTITNIISEFIGRGKTVLFVSEKIAALEVVANRLEEVELRDLVLEIHSARASRSQVAKALGRALEGHPNPDDGAAQNVFRQLRTARDGLNTYVEELHRRREPLGRSVFHVLEELSSLVDVPAIDGPSVSVSHGSDERTQIERWFERLRDAWLPVTEGPGFPWWTLIAEVGTAAQRDRVADLLVTARQVAREVAALDTTLARELELDASESQSERQRRSAFSDLARAPLTVPVEWLTGPDPTDYRDLLNRWTAAGREWADINRSLSSAYGDAWRDLPDGAVDRLAQVRAILSERLGDQTESWDDVASKSEEVQATLATITGGLDTIASSTKALDAATGVFLERSVRGAQTALALARSMLARHKPPSAWLAPDSLAKTKDLLLILGPTYRDLRRLWGILAARYHSAILDLDLDAVLPRMERFHGVRGSSLRPRYRADCAAIANVSLPNALPDSVMEDLALARHVRGIRGHMVELDGVARSVLGPYAQGLETDVDAIDDAIRGAETLIDMARDETQLRSLASMATYGTSPAEGTAEICEALERAVCEVITAFDSLLGDQPTPGRDDLVTWSRESVDTWISEVTGAAREGAEIVATVNAHRYEPIRSMTKVREELELRSRAQVIEGALRQDEPALRAAIYSRYSGLETDWDGLLAGHEWALQLRAAYGSALPVSVATRVSEGLFSDRQWDAFADGIARLSSSSEEVAGLFREADRPAVEAAICGPAEQAITWLVDRARRVSDLETWHEFQLCRERLETLGWGDVLSTAVERRVPADTLVRIASRSWLESWVGTMTAAVPVLSEFRAPEHQRLIKHFAEHDMRHIRLGRERALRSYADRMPTPTVVQGNELSIVRREAIKSRRHIAVRDLLGQVPTQLGKLKPCLMMSPLSVSQFLGPHVRFDLVVFDEASQVPPEDAVNCIYRGKQLIVAGDPKQLPPTDFFQISAQSEADGDLGDDLADLESVLDYCQVVGMPSFALQWHYRSRHDSLIAFSNHYIYDRSLVTFPAPVTRADDLGLSFVHVADGVFDRGRSARNPIEAERVIDVVEEHVTRWPDSSIGVVAFGVAQQGAVQDALDRRLALNPSLERQLGSDRLSGFFIKNLETVQGDERDVIVFTVGYGPDENGKIHQNFGALNRPGGARRLNVAVTRARRKVVVVSSMRAADLRRPDVVATIGELPPGAALLRSYLDYAERGILPDAQTRDVGGDLGLLEEDVASVISNLGFEVIRRVGTSRYRVALGVASRDAPDRIILGVETDGEMYRSARTARDRDRLRSAVLVGLGWKLHRIWSPEWHRRRVREIARLTRAIEQSAVPDIEGDAIDAPERPSQGTVNGPTPQRARVERQAVSLDAEGAVVLGWAKRYRVAAVRPYRSYGQFDEPQMSREHVDRIVALVSAEGPVHEGVVTERLARAFGKQRAGTRIATAVRLAISRAKVSGAIESRSDFLWAPSQVLDAIRVPVPQVPESQRSIDRIAPEELELAIRKIVELEPMSLEALVPIVARIFGFDRTGGRISSSVSSRIGSMLVSGDLDESGGRLRWAGRRESDAK